MKVTVISQPIERWSFVAIGALQGWLVWTLGEILDDRVSAFWDANLVGALIFLAIAPLLFFTLRYNASRMRSALLAVVVGALYYVLWALLYHRFGETVLGLATGAGLLGALLASGALRAANLSAAESFHMRLLLSTWSSILSLAVALLAAGIVLGLIAASAALIRFAGLKDVARFLTDAYVMASVFGASMAFMFALIAERDRLMDGVVQVIVLASRYLYLLVLGLIGLVLLAMALGSVSDLSRQVSVAGLSLGLSGAALVLGLSGAIEPPDISGWITQVLRFGWGLALPLVIIAMYATHLRIAQYGLTPERIFLIELCVLAAVLIGGLTLSAILPGSAFRDKTLGCFVGAVAAFLVLSVTPFVSWQDIANRNQAARLPRGEDGVSIDAAHYLWHYGGTQGQAILSGFEKALPQGEQRTQIAKIRESSRYRPQRPKDAFDQAALFETLPVLPDGAALPEGFASNSWLPDTPAEYIYVLQSCAKRAEDTCRIYVADVLPLVPGSEVLVFAERTNQMALFALRPESSLWRFEGMMFQREAADKDAADGFSVRPPDTYDVLLDGRRFKLN
ncbi:MAG: hypothetical protein AAF221_04805 [Pseudomonadota bacterium]